MAPIDPEELEAFEPEIVEAALELLEATPPPSSELERERWRFAVTSESLRAAVRHEEALAGYLEEAPGRVNLACSEGHMFGHPAHRWGQWGQYICPGRE